MICLLNVFCCPRVYEQLIDEACIEISIRIHLVYVDVPFVAVASNVFMHSFVTCSSRLQ